MTNRNSKLLQKISRYCFVIVGVISFLIFYSQDFKLSAHTETTLKSIVGNIIWVVISYAVVKIFSTSPFSKNEGQKANWTAVIILLIAGGFGAYILLKCIDNLPNITYEYNSLLCGILTLSITVISFLVWVVLKNKESSEKDEKILSDNEKIKSEIAKIKSEKENGFQYRKPDAINIYSKGFDYIELHEDNEPTDKKGV